MGVCHAHYNYMSSTLWYLYVFYKLINTKYDITLSHLE